MKLRLIALGLLLASACSTSLPREAPPLIDLEEPLELLAEPEDEAERRVAPIGGFTGLELSEARETLEEMVEHAEGLSVARIVENSPADAAGLVVGDLLLEAQSANAAAVRLAFPSQWRKLELETPPGTPITVVFDRAGVESETRIVTVPRVRLPPRSPAERFREEDRVGFVLRTATEMEARRHGLGPGGGAVVVGLSRGSPWRAAGVRFGDLILSVDGRVVDHPSVVLEAVRQAGRDDDLAAVLARGTESVTVALPVSRRRAELQRAALFPLFSHECQGDRSETEVLFGLFGYEETKAAWSVTLLWFIELRGGDSDRLEEVER